MLDVQRDPLRRLAEKKLPLKTQQRIDASDIVQQTCLSVFRDLSQFQGGDLAQFLAWVRQIHERNLRNVIRDHHHAQRRAVQWELPQAETDQLADPGRSPSEVVRAADEWQRLGTVLEQLPEREQRILRLRYQDECTLSAICEHMDLTRDAAVWLLQKALQRAKSLIGRRDGQPLGNHHGKTEHRS